MQLHKSDVVEERRQSVLKEQRRKEELIQKLREATSSAFIERQAREKLGLVKEGDTVILLDTSGLEDREENSSVGKLSNWEAWMKLFF